MILTVNRDCTGVDVDSRFLHVWYKTDVVDSTGKTNGITPMNPSILGILEDLLCNFQYSGGGRAGRSRDLRASCPFSKSSLGQKKKYVGFRLHLQKVVAFNP